MTDRRQTQPIDKGHEDPLAQYSESFRNRMVEKLTGPHAKSATSLSALARAALGLPCTPTTFAPARDPLQGELWFDDAS
jgi:hypothetical protein